MCRTWEHAPCQNAPLIHIDQGLFHGAIAEITRKHTTEQHRKNNRQRQQCGNLEHRQQKQFKPDEHQNDTETMGKVIELVLDGLQQEK